MFQRAKRTSWALHVRPLPFRSYSIALDPSKWFLEKTGCEGLCNMLAAYEVERCDVLSLDGGSGQVSVRSVHLCIHSRVSYCCLFARVGLLVPSPHAEPKLFVGRCQVLSSAAVVTRGILGVTGTHCSRPWSCQFRLGPRVSTRRL